MGLSVFLVDVYCLGVKNAAFSRLTLPDYGDILERYDDPPLPHPVSPACVRECIGNARYFGDLNDPDSLVSQLARSPRAFRLLEELGTHPKVIYLREG